MRSYLLACAVVLCGCDEVPDAPHYYERVIQPILTNSCVRNQGGCHKDDGSGNAFGNVDMTSYVNLTRRRDILRSFGAYPVPLLLLKASGAQVPPIPYKGSGDGLQQAATVTLPSQIDHVGLATISVDSDAYLTLLRWMESGANRDGGTTVRQKQTGAGACRKDFDVVRPEVAAQVGTVDVSSQAFKDFAANVEPVLAGSCAVGTCHSSQQSDFFLACQGSGSDDMTKFNFLEAQQYVAATPEASLFLLKPLAPSAGGISHTGGVFFANKDDNDWKALAAWAKEAGPFMAAVALSRGEQFFRDSVQPIFLQRGCALEACHSPGSANDFKLRAGTPGGFFSPFSLSFNYHEARDNFLVADIPDPRQTRIVKKPAIQTAKGGIGLVHRGGPPLQSPGDPLDLDPTACPQPWTAASTPYCTIVEWHRIERQALLTAGKADAFGARMPLVTVARPPNDDRVIDFDNYRPGADLRLGSVQLSAMGLLDEGSASDDASLIANCSGASVAVADVRHPAVSMDASKIAFAMRLSQNDSLDIYEVTLDAAHTCTKITDGNGMSANGIKIHNLDPMYAFDGSLVFASTRGRPGVGPTRSLKFLLPQTDLWRMRSNGSGGYSAPEQMTVLLGSELNPQMMLNGEVTFTAEKASADFYQLSGRRINWDLTDYHPLLAQRAKSPSKNDADISPGAAVTPSVGYSQATDIREGIDRNFVLILSDVGARGGGGTLATFNRSLGPFEADRSDINFLGAVTLFDAAATGRAGATQGAYRSPFSLPDGRYLVSYDPAITDLSAQTPRYDLVVFDPRTGRRTNVSNFTGPGASRMEAVLVYKREPRPMFNNLTQLVFGGHADGSDTGHAIVHYPDLPMLGTLLGANLRTGRFVDRLRPAKKLAIYEDQAPPSDMAAAMAGLAGSQRVYQNRKLLGTVSLADDGSARVMLPSMTPLILELLDDGGGKLFTMAEEDQLGPGERISRGVPQAFFNSVCGGCHGSVSGVELEIAVNPDALTQASVSMSRDVQPAVVP
jgi:hypothetical protein